jgi:superoxide dismutase, Fe-Mn family
MFNLRLPLAACLLSLLTACASSTAPMPTPEAKDAPITYTLPELPYSVKSLEPYIDAQTMTIHHTKHHQAYVDNLNKALKDTPSQRVPLETILRSVSAYPTAVRNNGGGHWNHSFFWRIMTPAATSGAPSQQLSNAINASFGSFESFKEKFTAEAMGRFGSGWTWLVKTPTGLAILSTPNQDSPVMDVSASHGTPILAVDVWEHAYYLKYQNKRAEYLKNWWNVVNWAEVSRLYERS